MNVVTNILAIPKEVHGVEKKKNLLQRGTCTYKNTFVFQIKNKLITTFTYFTKHKHVTHSVTASITT